MRAVLVLGGFGIIPLVIPALWVWLRPPTGRARFLPFTLSAAFGAIVAIVSLIATRFADGMEGLALVIPMMMGMVTFVASLIAMGIQASVQPRAAAHGQPQA